MIVRSNKGIERHPITLVAMSVFLFWLQSSRSDYYGCSLRLSCMPGAVPPLTRNSKASSKYQRAKGSLLLQ